MAGKYVVYKDKKGEHRFRLLASNGQIVLASEGYSTKAACMGGIASVQKNAGDAGRFERKAAKNGKPYFVLKAGNHRVVAQSQMYASAPDMEKGIKSVMSNGPTNKIAEE